jgi:hypothetical protein
MIASWAPLPPYGAALLRGTVHFRPAVARQRCGVAYATCSGRQIRRHLHVA